ncbi:MAG: response regulator [Chloroflexi bacterium]|nr:response regulator [Chloroflexota bacterium]
MTDCPSSAGNSPVRVLVVDDQPGLAQTLALAVSRLGSGVTALSATSARQALEMAATDAVDILITDMVMPEMTGLELVERLQNHPGDRPAYIILMTAYEVPGLKETARRLNIRETIIKPFHPERINQLVAKALEGMTSFVEPALEGDPQSFTILIADDMQDNITLLSRYVRNEGFRYLTAFNGCEALQKTRVEMPDLILLDVNMPEMDGFAVLKEIRGDPATRHLPVIILTAARPHPNDIESGLIPGADDYITKPFDRRELLARIRTKLRLKEARDALMRRNRELAILPEIGRELSARLEVQEIGELGPAPDG